MFIAPHIHLCNPRDTCPDCFSLWGTGCERYAGERSTLYRGAGEDDNAFWNRVVSAAKELQERDSTRGVMIFPEHDMKAPDVAHRSDAHWNFTRAMLHVAQYDRSQKVRLRALFELADYLGMPGGKAKK